MNKIQATLLIVLNIATPALYGAVAYRACMSGRGFGNSAGTALLATAATTLIVLVLLLVLTGEMAFKLRISILCACLATALLIHGLAF